MTHPRLRLAVAACLFLGWLGFLAYLVVRTRDPVILSRPQLLECDLVVVVEVKEKGGAPQREATFKETLWARDAKEALPATLQLPALPDVGEAQGWRGAGDYIVPLRKEGQGYEVAMLPLAPGFSPWIQVELVGLGEKAEEVLAWLEQHASVSVDEAKKASAKGPVAVKRNLDRGEANKLQDKLEELGAKVKQHIGEYRIYRATPDARAQVKQIKGVTLD
jgi:hypothetical protein